MSCPHAETTVAWMYGEADDAHAAHVASCPSCSALLADEEQVAAWVAPALPVAAPRPRRWAWGLVPLALAAGLLVAALAPRPEAPLAPVRVADTDRPAVPVAPDPFDAALDELDRAVLELSLDLEIL